MGDNGYHLNLHGQTSRSSGRRSTFTFGAATDAAAEAVAAEISNWTADQQTSLTKNIFANFRSYGANYPPGSTQGMNAVLWDSTAGAWRVRFRNVTPAADLYGIWAAILGGTAYVAIAGGNVVALSAPPLLPNTGNPVDYITGLGFPYLP